MRAVGPRGSTPPRRRPRAFTTRCSAAERALGAALVRAAIRRAIAKRALGAALVRAAIRRPLAERAALPGRSRSAFQRSALDRSGHRRFRMFAFVAVALALDGLRTNFCASAAWDVGRLAFRAPSTARDGAVVEPHEIAK